MENEEQEGHETGGKGVVEEETKGEKGAGVEETKGEKGTGVEETKGGGVEETKGGKGKKPGEAETKERREGGEEEEAGEEEEEEEEHGQGCVPVLGQDLRLNIVRALGRGATPDDLLATVHNQVNMRNRCTGTAALQILNWCTPCAVICAERATHC